jgi:hypothetical protein
MNTIITVALASTAAFIVKMTPYHEFIVRLVANA